ncbi:MAG TPA: hypothetical protein VF665_22990 [Longimicrobium sp.]|jgi:hypothetical protein|uniref:hypothetical protein n=1 Tax=Longimicrobium sp. TaxID=2029185 RepID=UPI002ED7FEA4
MNADEHVSPDVEEARRELAEQYPTVEALCDYLRALESELAPFTDETGGTDLVTWYMSRHGGADQPDGRAPGTTVRPAA